MKGGNHIIWDSIIAEENKLRPCLDLVLDKEDVIKSYKHSVIVVGERLNKKPIDCANNAIDFLNGLIEDELKAKNIKDRI